MNKNQKYDLLNLPTRLFKYYKDDKLLNVKRLSGEVYLASPLDFNDPCDCQRDVKNNALQIEQAKEPEWVANKLIELGYSVDEAQLMSVSLKRGEVTYVHDVYNRQVSKSGILCMTQNYADVLMWGYYAGNEGYCIEYDVNKLISAIVLGYVNNLDYTATKWLYQNRRYHQDPSQRTLELDSNLVTLANNKFKRAILTKISNTYLNEQPELNRLNFIRNVFLKRFVAQSIKYQVKPDGSPCDLFFDRNSSNVDSKYFCKTTKWKHENEFRILLSLGGRQIVKAGPECIKNVYIGCNSKREKIISMVYLLASLRLDNVGVYKMKKLKNGGLQKSILDFKDSYDFFREMSKQIK